MKITVGIRTEEEKEKEKEENQDKVAKALKEYPKEFVEKVLDLAGYVLEEFTAGDENSYCGDSSVNLNNCRGGVMVRKTRGKNELVITFETESRK